MKYKNWTILLWDGNPALNLKCWVKSFGKGRVSVGIGDFKHIVYSYGPDSDFSMSGTRARVGKPDQTEAQAMAMVDRNGGIYNSKDNN